MKIAVLNNTEVFLENLQANKARSSRKKGP